VITNKGQYKCICNTLVNVSKVKEKDIYFTFRCPNCSVIFMITKKHVQSKNVIDNLYRYVSVVKN